MTAYCRKLPTLAHHVWDIANMSEDRMQSHYIFNTWVKPCGINFPFRSTTYEGKPIQWLINRTGMVVMQMAKHLEWQGEDHWENYLCIKLPLKILMKNMFFLKNASEEILS